MKNFVRELLHLYQGSPALYETDDNWEGFEWVNADDSDRSIFSFIRHSKDGKSNLLFVVNFTPVERPEYRVGVPQSGSYKLVLNSDEARFGGSGAKKATSYRSRKGECDGKAQSIGYSLPAYGVAVFQYEKKEASAKKPTTRKRTVKKAAAKEQE